MTRQEAREKGITVCGDRRHITVKEFAESLAKIAEDYGDLEISNIGVLCGNGLSCYTINAWDAKYNTQKEVGRVNAWKEFKE